MLPPHSSSQGHERKQSQNYTATRSAFKNVERNLLVHDPRETNSVMISCVSDAELWTILSLFPKGDLNTWSLLLGP